MFKLKNTDSPGNTNSHYEGDIQPMEFSLMVELNPAEHNIVKYICRHRKKQGLLDLQKVSWHCELLKDFIEYSGIGQYREKRYLSRKFLLEGDFWNLFRKSQKLTGCESQVLENMLFWPVSSSFTLDNIPHCLEYLMEKYEKTSV